MKTILTIITVSKDGHRRNMKVRRKISDLDSYRKKLIESYPDVENIFFIYREKVE